MTASAGSSLARISGPPSSRPASTALKGSTMAIS